MKSILIIGLGRFGTHLIHRFYDLGDEVMAVDISEEKVQEAMPFVTSAKIGDCTKLDTLRTLGIKNFDLCFVCIGENFQSSLEITSLLHDMGAAKVRARQIRKFTLNFCSETALTRLLTLKGTAHRSLQPDTA